jgi:hypothetical protein
MMRNSDEPICIESKLASIDIVWLHYCEGRKSSHLCFSPLGHRIRNHTLFFGVSDHFLMSFGSHVLLRL